MIEIDFDIQPEHKAQPASRQRSIFAIGLIRYKSTLAPQTNSANDDMRVLGLMVVQDREENDVSSTD